MSAITARTDMQNEIRTLVLGSKFYRVVYDTATGAASMTTEELTPGTCVCNEVECRFEKDTRFGRHEALRKIGWTFDIMLEFAAEVSFEELEKLFTEQVPRIKITIDGEPKSHAVVLKQGLFEHPVTQSASSGSRARMIVEVDAGRN